MHQCEKPFEHIYSIPEPKGRTHTDKEPKGRHQTDKHQTDTPDKHQTDQQPDAKGKTKGDRQNKHKNKQKRGLVQYPLLECHRSRPWPVLITLRDPTNRVHSRIP